MNKQYYIKVENMYLSSLYVDRECPENEFISGIDFRTQSEYCDTYDEKVAEALREKLDKIGFGYDKTYKEEAKK